MKRSPLIAGALFAFLAFMPGTAFALPEAAISVSSESPIQGEPILIKILNASPASVRKITFGTASLPVLDFSGTAGALYGIDLNFPASLYHIKATLADGTVLEKAVTVIAREKVQAPLGIPDTLGGNTPAAATVLVSELARENAILAKLWSNPRQLWSAPFRWPVATPIITDPYGYSRETGAYSIAHKGADFRAAIGTPVSAINRGVVRYVGTFTDYGKTVIVDHGKGVMSFYMHLSKIQVSAGQLVAAGQRVGLAGDTGYAEAAHLHLTVRVGGISIDPVKFMGLFGIASPQIL